MPVVSILHSPTSVFHGLPRAVESAFAPTQAKPIRRNRIWELSANLHCSIVGTCLTTGDLWQLFAKLNGAEAKVASDHLLHNRAVRAAGQHDVAGKLLNKLLERRHERMIKRFARVHSPDDVRRLWLEALGQGDVPGAYWAVLTHPATDHKLVQEVFGEVHMLSHLVGMSNRADIRRLRQLELDLEARDAKIARQETRLQGMAEERSALVRKVEAAERRCAELGERERDPMLVDECLWHAAELSSLRLRLADEEARSVRLSSRLKDQADDARIAREEATASRDREEILRRELASLEDALATTLPQSVDASTTASVLRGLTLLYVGGRPRQVDQLRALTEDREGVLLDHDGGIENNIALLPGLISQADLALFPVDCISHLAAGQVKRLCREAQKPFLPLRSASIASFLAAIDKPEIAGLPVDATR